ncbi:putative transposase [Arthrobacter sp. CAN_A214]
MKSTELCRWTRQSTALTSTVRTFPAPQGDLPNCKKRWSEPEDHALGRSRGGSSTKIHHACDGKGRPLAFIIGPGQGSDSRMFPHVLEAINVPRPGTGRARTRPDAVWAIRFTLQGPTVVEQSFNIFEQWRSIATRYDKLTITYRSAVALHAVLIWLRQ